MSSPRWLQRLRSLNLEFWLPLPVLGLGFWVVSGIVTDQVFSRPYATVAQLEADTQLEVQLAVTVLVINADILKDQGLTRVEIKTTNSALKRLEFEFPVTEFHLVEDQIAKELGLSLENVRKLVRYQVNR